MAWLQRQIPPDARAMAVDVSSGMAVLGLMGPRSRELLSRLSDADFSNAAFPFGDSQVIDLAYARVRASRITYVGELGWELYIPTEFAPGVFDALMAEGEPLGLRLAGYHALNALRTEKGYRHWGHDISDEDTPLQAGLGFAVAWDKPGGFIGRDALLQQKEQGLDRRLVQFALDDPRRCCTTTNRSGATASSSGVSPRACSATRWASRWAWVMCPIPMASPIVTTSWVATMRSRSPASAWPRKPRCGGWYDPKSLRVKDVDAAASATATKA